MNLIKNSYLEPIAFFWILLTTTEFPGKLESIRSNALKSLKFLQKKVLTSYKAKIN